MGISATWLGMMLALGACGTSAAATAIQRSSAMTGQRRQACAPTEGTMLLIEEALLTRTAITAATAAKYAAPITLLAGDPRLPRLGALLTALPLRPEKLSQFEPRTFLQLTCADGTRLDVEVAATEHDGTVHLSIGDEQASTTAPLRRDLDQIAK